MSTTIETVTTDDDRLFAMLIYVLSLPFPVLAPLIIWLIKRDESAFVEWHGKEYFNFLISFTIYSAVSGILIFLLIGLLLLPIVGILALIFTIMAAVKAYKGEKYKIPMIIRFIK